MYKNSKYQKRSGFTLIELVLVMGITVIFLAITFAVFSIVNTSHAKVAVQNDVKDFADLNMQAIEKLTADANVIILSNSAAFISGETGYTSLYFKTDATTKESALYYCVDGSTEQKAFTWDQYTIKNGTQKKWSVVPLFTKSATAGIVHVKLQIIDNSSNTVYYTLEKDVIFLNIDNTSFVTNASGTVLKFKNFVP